MDRHQFGKIVSKSGRTIFNYPLWQAIERLYNLTMPTGMGVFDPERFFAMWYYGSHRHDENSLVYTTIWRMAYLYKHRPQLRPGIIFILREMKRDGSLVWLIKQQPEYIQVLFENMSIISKEKVREIQNAIVNFNEHDESEYLGF